MINFQIKNLEQIFSLKVRQKNKWFTSSKKLTLGLIDTMSNTFWFKNTNTKEKGTENNSIDCSWTQNMPTGGRELLTASEQLVFWLRRLSQQVDWLIKY